MSAFTSVLVSPDGAVVLPGRRIELPSLRGFFEGLRGKLRGVGLDMAQGFGDAAEANVLNSVFGDHATINLYATPTYIALCTATPGEADTGSTLTEAAYTSYTRITLPAASLSAASAGSKTNSGVLTGADCTGSSSVVQSFAVVSSATNARLAEGDVVMFGTCSSVTITTTQTPPTIAASALTFTLD